MDVGEFPTSNFQINFKSKYQEANKESWGPWCAACARGDGEGDGAGSGG